MGLLNNCSVYNHCVGLMTTAKKKKSYKIGSVRMMTCFTTVTSYDHNEQIALWLLVQDSMYIFSRTVITTVLRTWLYF